MSYYGNYYGKPKESRAEHEKAWLRTKSIAWDAKWHGLSVAARRVYLLEMKAPSKEGSASQQATLAEKLPAEAVEELVAAGFTKVEPARANRSGKVIPVQEAFNFSTRLREIHRAHLLAPSTSLDELARHVRYAFTGQGELTIRRVLSQAEIHDYNPLEKALEIYVASRRWPEWALDLCKSKMAQPLLERLLKADGPVPLEGLDVDPKGASPAEVEKALVELIANLAVFEDLDPETLQIVVGLLPRVLLNRSEASKVRIRPPLEICEAPKVFGPHAGLDLNDLRAFLLEVAGEAPRLRRDGMVFAKDETRFFEALPERPAWLDDLLHSSPEQRLDRAYSLAKTLKFVAIEDEDKSTHLRLAGKGRNWLAAGFEQQYAAIFEYYRATAKPGRSSYVYDDDYNLSYDDSRFLGLTASVVTSKPNSSRYASSSREVDPKHRDALRLSLLRVFESLPDGVFHRWVSVLTHWSFAEHNPLLGVGVDPLKVQINIDRRSIPPLPELVERAGQTLLDAFLKLRLIPLDAVQVAIDSDGQLCIARNPRLEGYFGRAYKPGEEADRSASRVIVQPDFSVVVIGLDPGPAAEIAPFCERAPGQGGQGALTFRITRDSVIRAAGQGLVASAIIARLKKHASVEVPENILREIREWTGWVRLVNVRPITVVRCPDEETATRVVSALGKKAERLGNHLVAIPLAKLSTAERQKLQERGILITKEDIALDPPVERPKEAAEVPAKKKPGRPRKVR